MIRVTDSAAELLRAVRERSEDPAGEKVLRLEEVGDQRVGLVMGSARADDEVVEREGLALLHLSPRVSDALDGAVIDRVETPEGPRLAFRPRSDEPQPDRPSDGSGPEG